MNWKRNHLHCVFCVCIERKPFVRTPFLGVVYCDYLSSDNKGTENTTSISLDPKNSPLLGKFNLNSARFAHSSKFLNNLNSQWLSNFSAFCLEDILFPCFSLPQKSHPSRPVKLLCDATRFPLNRFLKKERN